MGLSNLHKSNRVDVQLPDTDEMISLFNPRSHDWDRHFQWDGYRVVGRTSVGQATVDALSMNHARRIKIGQAEELFGLFPPTDDE